MLRKIACVFIVFIFPIVMHIQQARATDGDEQDNWQFDLAPFYLWAVSLDGDVAIGPKGDSITLDFGDIFDNLESIFIVHFETVYKERYGIFFDVNFIDIGQSISTPQTDINVDLKATVAELAPYYRWTKGDHMFDAFAGILYSKVETDATFSNIPPSISVSEDWVDPFLGGRWIWSFTEKWATSVKAGIGGLSLIHI